MQISCAKLLNVDACYIWMMRGQDKPVRSPIHSGVKMVDQVPEKDSPVPTSARTARSKETCAGQEECSV
jgi:hypothetical protein